MSREMKDSGIQWIGAIPLNWPIEKMKYCISNNDGGVWGNDPIQDETLNKTVLRSTEQTIDGKWTFVNPAKRFLEGTNYYTCRIEPGDLLITKSSGSKEHIGKTTIADDRFGLDEYYYSNFLQRLRVNSHLIPEFLWYLLNSPLTRGQFVYMQNSTSGIGNINAEDINNLVIPVPPISEQHRITDFLDSKCSQIDGISKKIQDEIDTLEEYKKSVITEAVTKGLDPNVEMKDSGYEWLGIMPVQWALQKGKYLFVQKNDRGNTINLQLLSPTQNYGVIPQSLYEELSGFNAVKLNDKTDFNQLKTVHKGAYVISLRSFQGGFEYSEYEGVVSPAYQVFYPVVNIDDRYYKYFFKTQIFIDKMNSYTMSLRDGKNIAFADFGNTYIPYPPKDEQHKIADYLDEKTSQINASIDAKKRQLEVIEEYKKSLIYEYVTGKKEVA